MRTYEPIWKQLKEKGIVNVRVATHLVPRLRKAVIKEKYGDEEFKVNYTSSLYIVAHNDEDSPLESIVTFRLTKSSNFIDKKGDE